MIYTYHHAVPHEWKAQYIVAHQHYMHPLKQTPHYTTYRATSTCSRLQYQIQCVPRQSTAYHKLLSRTTQILNLQIVRNWEISNIDYIIQAIQDQSRLYIVTHFYDQGNLTDQIRKGHIRYELQAIEYFRQICRGVMQLHRSNIIHKYLSSDKILVAALNDSEYPFNQFLVVSGYAKAKHRIVKLSKYYSMAPETEGNCFDDRADVYSLGCILYKMITGNEPFQGKTKEEIVKCKMSSQIYNNVLFKNTSPKIRNLITRCLVYNQENRMHSDELFNELKIDDLYDQYQPLVLYDNKITYMPSASPHKITKSHSDNTKLRKYSIEVEDPINTPIPLNDGGLARLSTTNMSWLMMIAFTVLYAMFSSMLY